MQLKSNVIWKDKSWREKQMPYKAAYDLNFLQPYEATVDLNKPTMNLKLFK